MECGDRKFESCHTDHYGRRVCRAHGWPTPSKTRFDSVVAYHLRRIRLVVWVSGFHPEGESSILSCGTNDAPVVQRMGAALRKRSMQVRVLPGVPIRAARCAGQSPSKRQTRGWIPRRLTNTASAMDATDPPKVGPLGSNPSEVANCARGETVNAVGSNPASCRFKSCRAHHGGPAAYSHPWWGHRTLNPAASSSILRWPSTLASYSGNTHPS